MGLDLDATYDEIEAAFNDLTAQYAGDAKRKIKLSVAKDKILDDRLRQLGEGVSRLVLAHGEQVAQRRLAQHRAELPRHNGKTAPQANHAARQRGVGQRGVVRIIYG